MHSGQCVVELDADARVLVLVTDDLGRHRGDVQREAVRHVDARDAPDLRLDVRTVVVEIERQEVRVAGGSTSVKRGQEHSTLEHERIANIGGGKPAQEALQRVEHRKLLEALSRCTGDRLQGEVLLAAGLTATDPHSNTCRTSVRPARACGQCPATRNNDEG